MPRITIVFTAALTLAATGAGVFGLLLLMNVLDHLLTWSYARVEEGVLALAAAVLMGSAITGFAMVLDVITRDCCVACESRLLEDSVAPPANADQVASHLSGRSARRDDGGPLHRPPAFMGSQIAAAAIVRRLLPLVRLPSRR
jgi:hypothetical protein